MDPRPLRARPIGTIWMELKLNEIVLFFVAQELGEIEKLPIIKQA
jgi:hypothetical protein